VIDGSGITATASNEWTSDYQAAYTVDGSGLNATTGEHTNGGAGVVWMSNEDANVAWIQWDLGDLYVLDSVHVWNMNMDNQAGSGIWQTDIWVSSLTSPGDPEGAGASNWTRIGTGSEFPVAPFTGTQTTSDGYTGFDLETEVGNILPSTAVRFVRFEIISKWAENPDSNATNQFGRQTDFPGLSEIQFTAVPEPSSFALIAGFLGLTWIMLRRR